MRTPLEARQWRRRMLGRVAFAVSLVLVVNALVGENGYLDTMRAQAEAGKLTEQLRQEREKTQEIRDEIHRLRTDPAAVEEALRRELNLGKPGETLVIIKDQAKPKTPHQMP
jgi:cell division protein FtsB